MKRGHYRYLFLAVLIIAGIPGIFAQLSSCSVENNCVAPFISVGKVTTDGHFNPTGTMNLCCSNVYPGTGVVAFKYSDAGHISVNSAFTTFPNNISLGFVVAPTLKTECDYASHEICLFKMNTTAGGGANSHMYDCDDVSPGKQKVCVQYREICGDGMDNDFDGATDCVDEECYATPQICTGSPLTSDYCVSLERNILTGVPDITYNHACNESDGDRFYCSYAEGSAVGVCCESGKVARQNVVTGVWSCVASEPCGLKSEANQELPCIYDFDINTTEWRENYYKGDSLNWCVSRMPQLHTEEGNLRSTACCLIVKQGEVAYYTDNDNVKIFGTS